MALENVLARARMARVAGVCVFIALFGAVSASAASPAQENRGQELPLTTTVPTDGAVTVRPDTSVSFQLDTNSAEYRAFRQQLESGRFAIQVEGGSSTQLFVGEATFDARTGTVSTPALSLGRYTTYTVTLAVKAAYEALLHGEPLPGNDSVTVAFVTGSALHEPTHYQLAVDDAAPQVTGKARLSVVATDDYGNPAWGSSVSVSLTENGDVQRSFSAKATPAQAVLAEPNGVATLDLTDTEAEGVQVSLQATGLHPENAWGGSAALHFRPGPPARFLSVQLPSSVASETSFNVCSRLTDTYENVVESGTPFTLKAGSSTTTAFTEGVWTCASLMAPYGQGPLLVSLSSGAAQYTASTTLLAPPPALLNLRVYPRSGAVPADGYSQATIVAEVYDSKMRPVLDGVTVSWSTTLGTLSASSTSTWHGAATVALVSSTPGDAAILVRIGSLSNSTGVTFTPMPAEVASISNVTYSQPCWSGAGYMSYGSNYGYHFRAKQGLCGVLVSGIARAANGAPVPNASVMVSLRTDSSWNPTTVTTDSSGRFTAYVNVPTGPASMVSAVYENGSLVYHHWDWGYLYFIANGQLVDPWNEQIYLLGYVSSTP